MQKILNRIIVSVFLLGIIWYLVLFGEMSAFFALCLAIVITMKEFYNIVGKKVPVKTREGILLGLLIPTTFFLYSDSPNRDAMMSLIAAFTIIFFISVGVTKGEIKESINKISYTLFGIGYISFLFTHLLFLLSIKHKEILFLGNNVDIGRVWLFIAFAISSSSDISAFVIGKLFGRTLLSPKISPNKTFEGLIGCVISGFLLAFWVNSLPLNLSLVKSLLLCVFGSILAQIGDLGASMLKREFEVKDSSTLLMSHGGLLDRCDSILFVGPFVFYFINFFG